MPLTLKNKIIFISGSSSGIGEACAKIFAQHGAKLILCARRRDRLETLAKYLAAAYNTKSQILPLDIRDHLALSRAMKTLPKTWRKIDILINNAGLAVGLDTIQAADIADWEKMIDTNCKGLLYLTHAILPGMIERNEGHIINIGSIAGHEVYANAGVYCATKHAVYALTKGFKMDLLGTNIRVTSVDPGLVETEFSEVRFKGDKKRAKKVYKGLKPLTPEDVAEAVYFCASRPKHVNVLDVILMPTAQASATQVHRK